MNKNLKNSLIIAAIILCIAVLFISLFLIAKNIFRAREAWNETGNMTNSVRETAEEHGKIAEEFANKISG